MVNNELGLEDWGHIGKIYILSLRDS